MDDQGGAPTRAEILARLRRVEGQIRGIQRMVEEERDCEEIVTQLLAARAALDKAGMLIMGKHIEQCLLGTGTGATPPDLDRVVSFFLQFARLPEADERSAQTRADSIE